MRFITNPVHTQGLLYLFCQNNLQKDPLNIQRNPTFLYSISKSNSSSKDQSNESNDKQQDKQKQKLPTTSNSNLIADLDSATFLSSTTAASMAVSPSDIITAQQKRHEEQERLSINSYEEESGRSAKNDDDKKLTPKAFNAFLLLASFGFAFYSILTVDEGMTRGWSIAEKAMRIPIDNWSSYESSLNAQPVFTKTMINVVIYLLGDWLSQTLFIKKNLLEFDAWRTMRNGLIGMVFGPCVHQYYEWSDYILPVNVGMNRFYKIAMDQTIYIFIKCSVYIVAVNMLAGESWQYSRDEAKGKIKGIMFTAWKFWPLVHCVTYGAIPARHRILWVNCVDLFWNAILASMASGSNDDKKENSSTVDITDITNGGSNASEDDKMMIEAPLIDENDFNALKEVLVVSEKQEKDETENLFESTHCE